MTTGISTQSFELFWLLSCACLLIFSLWQSFSTKRISQHLLFFICGGSLFWQEFYADWGAFLEWNPDFHMMPWGKTLWSIEHKPWFNIAAYPVFMWAAFTVISTLIKKFGSAEAPRKLFLQCALIAGPVLYLFNVVTEYFSVALFGLWTYTETIGPALHSEAGTMPLLYPGIPFASFAVILSFLMHWRSRDGSSMIEQRLVGRSLDTSPTAKIVFWIIAWNTCYWLALCTPLLVIRINFAS